MADRLRARLRVDQARDIPPAGVTLRTDRPNPTPSERSAMVMGVFSMGPGKACELYAWIERRASEYFEGPGIGWGVELCTFAACRDFTAWVRRDR